MKQSIENMNKNSIRVNEQGIIELVGHDGNARFCPYLAPVPVPIKDMFGNQKVGFQRFTCNSECLHFSLVEKQEKYDLELTCGSSKKFLDLNNEDSIQVPHQRSL